MTEGDYIVGKKPDREIPNENIGKLEPAPDDARNAGPDQREISGRISPFWVKCWSCHKFLTRPLSPPSEQAYTCPNCGAVNMV
jgi:hypothetical protein